MGSGKPPIFIYLGVGTSGFLTFAWFILLVSPMKWIHVKTPLADFQVNLFSVYMKKGILADIGCATGLLPQACDKLTSMLDQSWWISDAKDQFCQVKFACEDWNNLWIATWITAMFGFAGVIAFGIGAVSMAYYTMQHATETGRRTTMISLSIAPGCFAFGMLWFALMSNSWGTSPEFVALNAMQTPHASYSSGFIFGWFFTILSVVPIVLMAIFGKADQFEKKRGEDPNDLDGLYPGAYDAYGQNAYGQQQQWPPQQGGMMQPNGRQMEMGQMQMNQWPPQSGGFGGQVQVQAYAVQAPAPGFGGAAW